MLHFLDLAGTAVFAVTGALAGGRRHMDLFGVVVIALVTALGGGTVRDVVLGVTPVFWVNDTTYLLVGVAAAAVTFVYARLGPRLHGALVVLDAFGLAIFTVVGAQKAMDHGCAGIIVVLMGMATGVVGGMVRDVLCACVPLILRREIYATAALAGGVVLLALARLDVPLPVYATVAVATVLAIRLAALRWNLSLPIGKDADPNDHPPTLNRTHSSH